MNRIQLYLEQLNEGNKVLGAKSPGDLEGAKNATINPLDTSSTDGIDDPEEPEHLQGVTEDSNTSKTKFNTMSKDNVFDRLYKQAINEEFDDMAPEPGGMSGDNLGGGNDFGGESSFGGGDDFEDEGGAEDYDAEGHVGKVKEAMQLLQQAMDILTSFEGEEEEEYEEYEEPTDELGGEDDFGGEDDTSMDDSEPVTEEETHTQFGKAKTVGHALVSREKFNKGQDKKGNMLVKGANPSVAKKKATVPPGQKADGKLSKFSEAGLKKMQGKGNMKVPSRNSNVGKFAFED